MDVRRTAVVVATLVGTTLAAFAQAQPQAPRPMGGSPAASASGTAPAASTPPAAAPGAGEHARFSAGSPGDPKARFRTVEVVMREGGGTMVFVPDHLDVRRNERIRFIIKNIGELDHEFILATTEENLAHKHFMARHPEMVHNHANGRTVAAGQTTELLWTFDKRGQFEFGCLIPGHREAGMVGSVTVK